MAAVIFPLSACAPAEFNGRLILQGETENQMAGDTRCQNAWDAKLYGLPAHACSWVYDDPMSPGRKACHITYEVPTASGRIYEELGNCAKAAN